MPCVTEEFPHERAARHAREEAEVRRSEREKFEPLLCSACRSLEERGFDFDTNPELSRWWDAHKKADAERERKEQAKRLELEAVDAALAKSFKDLTDSDKKLLRKHGYTI